MTRATEGNKCCSITGVRVARSGCAPCHAERSGAEHQSIPPAVSGWQSGCSRWMLGVALSEVVAVVGWGYARELILPALISRAPLCGTQLFLTHNTGCLFIAFLFLHAGNLRYNWFFFFCFSLCKCHNTKTLGYRPRNTMAFYWATSISRWIKYALIVLAGRYNAMFYWRALDSCMSKVTAGK